MSLKATAVVHYSLTMQTASELNMITLHVNKVSPSVSSNDIAKKYPSIYNGISKLKNFEVKLYILINRCRQLHNQPA